MEKRLKQKDGFLSAGALIVAPIAAQALSDSVGKLSDRQRRKIRLRQIQLWRWKEYAY